VNYTVGGTARLVATTSDPADYRFAGSTSTATSRTVTFAAGSATATVTVDPTADTRAEANETVTLQLAAGTGYTLATTAPVSGTIRNDDIIGTAANNVLIGTADADLIDGLAGTDTLTGLASADRFAFRFSQSSITAPDRITDFAFNSDKISLLSATGSPLPLPSAFSRAADNPTAATLLQLANRMFADANGALAGNQPLAPNAAVLVRATNSAIAGTYLLINDPVSPLNANIDLLINLTGHSGTLPAIGTIDANRVFA
jgi:Ca2+-binding RTX toxin-like protein